MGDDNVVEYEVPRLDLPWLRRVWIVLLILAVVVVLGQWFGRHRVTLNSIGFIVIALGALAIDKFGARRPRRLVADDDAIRRPRPLHDLSWCDVDHVQATTRWSDTVRVVMTDGSVKPTGFPPDYAERLASAGNKPLK